MPGSLRSARPFPRSSEPLEGLQKGRPSGLLPPLIRGVCRAYLTRQKGSIRTFLRPLIRGFDNPPGHPAWRPSRPIRGLAFGVTTTMAITADIPITFRVTPALRDELERRAHEAGGKASAATYARDIVTRYIGLTLPDPRDDQRLSALTAGLDRLVQEALKHGERRSAEAGQELLSATTGIAMPAPIRTTRTTDHLTPDRLEAVRELSKVGGLLNQITRHINSGGLVDDKLKARTEAVVAQLAETIKRIADID